MSFHNNPNYHIPELIEALKAHRLPHDTPSQLADSFRIGWMACCRELAQADSVLEDAARLKEAVGLLEELAEHDNYSTEYDGRMLSICPECGEQDGEHRAACAFVRAKAFLAARK